LSGTLLNGFCHTAEAQQGPENRLLYRLEVPLIPRILSEQRRHAPSHRRRRRRDLRWRDRARAHPDWRWLQHWRQRVARSVPAHSQVTQAQARSEAFEGGGI
jgi:hypothetical protein